ncbi:MAG TPA: SGNH/GDSL hydrolase family protein [Polyangiales bacterium]|jgi:lysophospholipase L1-like esterase
MMEPRSKSVSVASPCAKLALALFGCILALAIAELTVRLLHLGPDTNVVFADNFKLSDDRRLQYELVPGSVDGDAKINRAGFRDREYPREKARGAFRIAVIGDSIAYGFGLPQSDALAKQLEDLLQSYHSAGITRFEVLNFGVSGYNIDQIVENLRARVLGWQPDLVLYAYCLNDPQAQSFELDSLEAKLSPAARAYRDLLQSSQHALAHSRLFLLAKLALTRADVPPPTAAKPRDAQWQALRTGDYGDYFSALYRGEDQKRLQNGIAALARLSRERRVPLVAATFPLFIDLDAYRLNALHSQVSDAFRAAGLRDYDLLAVYQTMFRQHGPLFVLNALHPNALGVRLAALYLLRAFMRDGVLPAALEPWSPSSELAKLDVVLDRVIAETR